MSVLFAAPGAALTLHRDGLLTAQGFSARGTTFLEALENWWRTDSEPLAALGAPAPGALRFAGGQPGQVGINRVVRSNGTVEPMDHIGQTEMASGDVFEINTPGGGGYGAVPVDQRGT